MFHIETPTYNGDENEETEYSHVINVNLDDYEALMKSNQMFYQCFGRLRQACLLTEQEQNSIN